MVKQNKKVVIFRKHSPQTKQKYGPEYPQGATLRMLAGGLSFLWSHHHTVHTPSSSLRLSLVKYHLDVNRYEVKHWLIATLGNISPAGYRTGMFVCDSLCLSLSLSVSLSLSLSLRYLTLLVSLPPSVPLAPPPAPLLPRVKRVEQSPALKGQSTTDLVRCHPPWPGSCQLVCFGMFCQPTSRPDVRETEIE